jgi:hypothetical protein
MQDYDGYLPPLVAKERGRGGVEAGVGVGVGSPISRCVGMVNLGL